MIGTVEFLKAHPEVSVVAVKSMDFSTQGVEIMFIYHEAFRRTIGRQTIDHKVVSLSMRQYYKLKEWAHSKEGRKYFESKPDLRCFDEEGVLLDVIYNDTYLSVLNQRPTRGFVDILQSMVTRGGNNTIRKPRPYSLER